MLFERSPIGIGSEEVESLPSRIIRTAWAHGYSVAKFIRFAVTETEVFSEGDYEVIDKNLKPADFIANGRKTAFIIKLFEELYCDKTFRLTSLYDFSKNVMVAQYIMDSRLKWCPACFAEHVNRQEEPYLRMYWIFRSVNVCLTHNVKLESECQSCGSPSRFNKYSSSMAICSDCGFYIFSEKYSFNNLINGELSIQIQLRELSAEISRGFLPTISNRNINIINFMCSNIDGYENQELLSDMLGNVISLDELYISKRDFNEGVSLYKVIRLCEKFNISILEVLHGKRESRQLSFFNNERLYAEAIDIRPKVDRSRDHRKVADMFYRVMGESSELEALYLTAKKLNVSVGYLEYRLPTGVMSYRERYKSESVTRYNREVDRVLHYVKTALRKYGWPDRDVSRKRIVGEVRDLTGASRNIVNKICKKYMARPTKQTG